MSDQQPSLAEQLGKLLGDAGATVQIGLRAQGHLPTVERMLAAGASWDEIGKVNGWHGPTAEKWFRMESQPSPAVPLVDSEEDDPRQQHYVEVANTLAKWIDACQLPSTELGDVYGAHVLLGELIRERAQTRQQHAEQCRHYEDVIAANRIAFERQVQDSVAIQQAAESREAALRAELEQVRQEYRDGAKASTVAVAALAAEIETLKQEKVRAEARAAELEEKLP